jgi:hypothetical protein
VYEYANDTGSTQYIRTGAQTGDVNDRSLSVLARIVAGAGTVKLGLYDESGGTFSGSAISDGYATRTLIHGQTPGDTDETCALEVPDGVTVRFIGMQMETGSRCTSIIPNYQTAATAQRIAEILTLPVTPLDGKGAVSFGLTPIGWDSGDLGVACKILERSGGATFLVSAEVGGAMEAADGTSTVGTQTVTDGTRVEVRVHWGSPAGLSLTVGGTTETVAYDGALPQSGTLTLEASGGEIAVDNVRVYREAA